MIGTKIEILVYSTDPDEIRIIEAQLINIRNAIEESSGIPIKVRNQGEFRYTKGVKGNYIP